MESGSGEGLEIPANAEVEGETAGGADRILGEGGVVVAVGVGGICAEVLQVVFRHGVGVGAERGEWEPGFHGREGEGIDFDGIEDVFAALLAGEIVVEPGDEGIAAEFERVVAGIEAESFGELAAMFASGAREQIGATDAVDDVGDFDQRVGGIGVGLLQVTGELGAEMADEARGEA